MLTPPENQLHNQLFIVKSSDTEACPVSVSSNSHISLVSLRFNSW